MANEVLWFRKFKNSYNQNEMPSNDKIMVIGHTREADIRGKNIDLIDGQGRTIKVHCVDGGIAYNGGMLKYDGKNEVFRTIALTHNDTSKLPKEEKINIIIDDETILKSYILCKVLNEREAGFHQLIAGSNPSELDPDKCKKIIEANINLDTIQEEYIKRSIYVKTTLFDFILENQIKRMQEQNNDPSYSIHIAAKMIETFLKGTNDIEYINRNRNNGKGNYYHITSKNYARDIAKILGPESLIEVLYIYECKTVEEYIHKKYLNTNHSINHIKR